MKKRLVSILLVIMILILAIGCSKKEEPIDLLYPESQATRGPVLSTWKNDKAGTLTFYEGNFVKVEFSSEYEYLLKDYGDDSRTFENNKEYHCNFFNKLTEASMEEATSFYIWFVNGAQDYNLQWEFSINGNTMTLHAYWPYDSGELIFTKAA